MSVQHAIAEVYAPAQPAKPYTTLPDLTCTDTAQSRDISLRVHWPDGTGPHPLVVFSHGSVCSYMAYDELTTIWAAHGYAVLAPLHPDGLEAPQSNGPPDLGKLLAARIRDLSFVLDALPQVESAVDGHGHIDTSRIAVAGHSFGALTALIKAGLTLQDDAYALPGTAHDDRYRAALSMSGVGNLPPMTADAFAGIDVPMLASGGTLDEGNVGAGPVFPWEWRLTAYAEAHGPDKYRLAIQDADHYFGGLIARDDRGGTADPQGLTILAATTLAFLDAYVNEDERALDWLSTTHDIVLGDKNAELEHK